MRKGNSIRLLAAVMMAGTFMPTTMAFAQEEAVIETEAGEIQRQKNYSIRFIDPQDGQEKEYNTHSTSDTVKAFSENELKTMFSEIGMTVTGELKASDFQLLYSGEYGESYTSTIVLKPTMLPFAQVAKQKFELIIKPQSSSNYVGGVNYYPGIQCSLEDLGASAANPRSVDARKLNQLLSSYGYSVDLENSKCLIETGGNLKVYGQPKWNLVKDQNPNLRIRLSFIRKSDSKNIYSTSILWKEVDENQDFILSAAELNQYLKSNTSDLKFSGSGNALVLKDLEPMPLMPAEIMVDAPSDSQVLNSSFTFKFYDVVNKKEVGSKTVTGKDVVNQQNWIPLSNLEKFIPLGYVYSGESALEAATGQPMWNLFSGYTHTINVKPAQSTTVSVTMFRLYNPNSGEHFYTSSNKEKDYLVKAGWKSEGEGWKAPESSAKPVYRLYNPNAGDHHYTLDKNEHDYLVKVGWNDEGIGWYSADDNGQPLYRQYNPNAKTGTHNYTAAKKEHDFLVSNGWKDEGIAWYGLK